MEWMQNVFGLLASSEIGAWVLALIALMQAASGITMLTPTKIDNQAVDLLLRVLNWLSLNVYKNKNADDI